MAIMALLEENPVIKNYVTQTNTYAEDNEYKYPYIE